MKEKDFDDIGKRLHDMEADPPKDGWKKIIPAVQGTGHSGKIVWMRKNGWKPLILLIPALIYLFLYKGQHGDTVNLLTTESTQAAMEYGQQKKADSQITTESIETNNTEEKTNDLKTEKTDQLPADLQPLQASLAPDEKRSERRQQDQATVVSDSAGNAFLKENKTSIDQKSESESIRQQKITTEINSLITAGAAIENKTDENEARAIVENQQTAITLTDTQDTLAVTESNEKIQSTDSTERMASDKETKKNKEPRSWRLTATVAPQFVSNTVKPLTTDEVLVTTVNQGSSTQQMGFSFALGAGKAITSNLYIDGQLTSSSIQQDLQYTYTNGAVDTLLTMEQPDMSYLITPVYHVENREVSGKYSYAGLQFGTTYYFLKTARRRFNLTANVGIHYLLSADVKERIGDEWVPLSNENLNEINYSFSIGAGYNHSLGKGWEVMISPTLTWYLKEVKSQSVPFSLREEALGLNFMFSKTLGR